MSKLNNSGKKARWVKSVIQGEDFYCSLCGAANWHWDDDQEVCKSRFCPMCGAEMVEQCDYLDINEAIEEINRNIAPNEFKRSQLKRWLMDLQDIKKYAVSGDWTECLKIANK